MKQIVGLLSFIVAIQALSVQIYTGSHIIPARGKDEDRCAIVPLGQESILGVLCDGHGNPKQAHSLFSGRRAAEKVTEHLPVILGRKLEENSRLDEKSITEAIAELSGEMQDFKETGTTLAAILVTRDLLYLINLGDSRIVLSNNGQAEQPLEDHACDNSQELSRINALGNFYIKTKGCQTHKGMNLKLDSAWQCPMHSTHQCMLVKAIYLPVNGATYLVRYTRSLGDNAVKGEGVISSEAEIKEIALTSDYKFAIIASDGVFERETKNHISNQEAVDYVDERIKEALNSGQSLSDAAQFASEKLAGLAKVRLGFDDISVVVMLFEH